MSRGALGGGTFVTPNKVLPGSYINFASVARAMGSMGERGTVAMAIELDWGATGRIITIDSTELQTEALELLGHNYIDDELKPLRDASKGAREIKLYRLNGQGAKKAEVSIEGLKVIAKYPGKRGNDIKISVQKNIDNENEFEVITYFDNIERDIQVVSKIEELKSNGFAEFTKVEGELRETAGISLAGGENGEVTGESYATFLDLIERESFNTICYAGEDGVTKSLFDAFTKRLRDEDGYKITCVLYDYAKADFEGVISVKNNPELVYWYAGQTAGANFNESLTNKAYDGEYEIDTKFKKREFIDFIEEGHAVLYQDGDDVRVLKDINTFISFEPYKNKDFSDNRVMRVLDQIANDTAIIFNKFYLGKADNDATGRDLFKNELVSHREQLQQLRAIQNFDYDNIQISKGKEKGDVMVNEMVEPTGSMEKLYMKVQVI